MPAKIRTEFYVVLVIALILIVYKFYWNRGANPTTTTKYEPTKPKNINSKSLNYMKFKTVITRSNISKFQGNKDVSNIKYVAQQPGSPIKPVVLNDTAMKSQKKHQIHKQNVSSTPFIKKFKQVWKKSGTIFYREIVPKGTPKLNILLLHGHSFTSETWVKLKTMNILASAGFRVISVDLPGYGRSKSYQLTDKTSDGMVKFLGKFLLKANFVSPVIVSPSASGVYSLAYVTSQRKVSGFIPIAVVATDRFAQKDFKDFKAPTLILRGSKDNLLGKRSMAALLQAIPHSTTRVIEDAGHACYINKPVVFHEILLQFLNSIVGK